MRKDIDLLFVSFNRFQFTRKSLACLIRNTDFKRVRKLYFWDDGSTDGTLEYVFNIAATLNLKPWEFLKGAGVEFRRSHYGSPVAVMNAFILETRPGVDDFGVPLFAKIDSDTCVPRGWMDACTLILDRRPEVSLLGIEAMCGELAGFTAVISNGIEMPNGRDWYASSHIGGIGFMRGRAFERSLPRPDGRFGFTAWQNEADPVRGFIQPALPVVLLDRVPEDPWSILSVEYQKQGWQRPWAKYDPDQKGQWSWLAQVPACVEEMLLGQAAVVTR